MNILGDLFAAPKQDGLSDAQMLSMAMQLRSQQLQDERANAMAARQEANYNLALRRQGEVERKNAETEAARERNATRQIKKDQFAAETDAGKLEFDRSKYSIEQQQQLQKQINERLADTESIKTNLSDTVLKYTPDSKLTDSRQRVGSQQLMQFVQSPEGLAMANDLGLTPGELAGYVDRLAIDTGAMANDAFGGRNRAVEQDYSGALRAGITADRTLRDYGIVDSTQFINNVDANRYLSGTNPNGMTQAAVLRTSGVSQTARDMLLNDKTLQKLSDMYPNNPQLAAHAGHGLATNALNALAEQAQLPVGSLAAMIADDPRLLDEFLGVMKPGAVDAWQGNMDTGPNLPLPTKIARKYQGIVARAPASTQHLQLPAGP